MAEADLRLAQVDAKNADKRVARAQLHRPLHVGLRLLVSAEGIGGDGARYQEQDVIRIDGESGVGGAEGFTGAARQAQISGLWEVHPGIVGGEIDRPIGLRQDLDVVVGPGVAPPVVPIKCVGFGASSQSLRVVGVDLERALEQGPRLEVFALAVNAAIEEVVTAHGQIDDVRILGASASFGFGAGQGIVQTVGQSRHDVILQFEEIGQGVIEPVGPEMRPGFGVDELRVDADAVLVALDGPFEHVADAELFPNLLGVDAFALVSEGCVARDDETVRDARKLGGEVLGDAVGEIVLARSLSG